MADIEINVQTQTVEIENSSETINIDVRAVKTVPTLNINNLGGTKDINVTNNNAEVYAKQAKTYKEQAEQYSQIASNSASNASTSATSAETSSDNAQVWAEGTDSEVQALGGTHSAEGWVDYVLTNPPTATVTRHSNYATVKTTYVDDGEEVESEANIYDGSGAVDDVKVNGASVLSDKVANVTVPTKTSDLENDENFIDNTVDNLTNYTKTSDLPTNLSDFTDDLGANPTHTHSQYLTNVKTINNESIVGSGNIDLDSKYLPIGKPFISLDNNLPNNCIWLEGAEVSKTTYANLYTLYGDVYGTPESSDDFLLPDFRDRSLWGTSDSTYGYMTEKLPNLTGTAPYYHSRANQTATGVFTGMSTGTGTNTIPSGTFLAYTLPQFNASNSSSVYQDNAHVTPNSVKCRVYTRYQ